MPDQYVRRRGDQLSVSELHELLRLRVDVFVVEQECAYAELDGLDLQSDTAHIWLSDHRGITAYLRLLGVGAVPIRIGRVVTRADRRGDGLAAKLLGLILEELGPIETRLEAQSHLADWYQRLGYRVEGDEYIEDGIPHVPMVRPAPSLGQAASG